MVCNGMVKGGNHGVLAFGCNLTVVLILLSVHVDVYKENTILECFSIVEVYSIRQSVIFLDVVYRLLVSISMSIHLLSRTHPTGDMHERETIY